MAGILYLIAAILIIGWVVSFIFSNFVSPLFHLLLVIGLIILVYQFVIDRRRLLPVQPVMGNHQENSRFGAIVALLEFHEGE